MTASYVKSSFQEHASRLGFISECPIQWDAERECLCYKSASGKFFLKLWHFNMFLSVDTITACAIMYNFVQTLRSSPEKPYVELPVALILSLLGILTYYVIVNHAMITLYGKDLVNGFNVIVKLEGQLVGGAQVRGKLACG